VKIAPVGQATDDEETPLHRIQGKFRCSNDIPDDVGTVEPDITAETVVIGESESAAGEIPELQDLSEFIQLPGTRRRVSNNFRQRAALTQDFQLAGYGLTVVAETAA
jgi:hypothetical protein